MHVVITTKVGYAAHEFKVLFLYGVLGRYCIGTTVLVITNIARTQKWALPFPCSKTKSKISFSHGWVQAVITTRCYFLGNVQSEDMFINGMEFFGEGYLITTSVVVCCYNNETQKKVSGHMVPAVTFW